MEAKEQANVRQPTEWKKDYKTVIRSESFAEGI